MSVLVPGWFNTAQTAVPYEDPAWAASTEARIPAGRTGQPNDMDGAVVFLASDASECATGQWLIVDGGFDIGAMQTMPRQN